ncbi:YggS family pyridoxal phosphate-dependent enzyme [bacterium]|nr:YggS family pyridoxal phosphate-dependent enzyme [bacterium]
METRKKLIQNNIQKITNRIAVAAEKSSRSPQEVKLVAVTKNVALQDIRFAIDSGIQNIGENKIQEAKKKFAQLGPAITWHMIGHLQTNKARSAAAIFDMVQSLDSKRIADALDRSARQLDREISVLVEVNIGAEEQKFGIEIQEVRELIHYVAQKKNLLLKGLMAMAPYVYDAELIRPFFRQMSHLFGNYKLEIGEHWKWLSMGMTHDFEVAIEEGSNMVRVGTGIFHTPELRGQG